jgi:hypothetical protein
MSRLLPYMSGFLDEMSSFEKEAAKTQKHGVPTWELAKHLGKKIGLYALGAGVGSGLGYAFNEKVTPKIIARYSPQNRAMLALAAGSLAGMLGGHLTHKVLSSKDWKPSDKSKRKR